MTTTKQALIDANACYDAAAYGLARAARAAAGAASTSAEAEAVLTRAIDAIRAARVGLVEAEAAVTD